MFLALAAALGGSTLVLVPRRNLADQTAAALARHFPSIPTHPEGPDAAGRPGRRDLHLPGGAAPPGADGLGVGDAPDLRRGPRHPRRADAQAARPGGQRGRRRLHRHGRDHHRATWSRSSARSRPPSTGCRRSSAASSARCARCASSARSTSPTSPRCAATSTRPAWAAPSTGPCGTAPAPRCGWSTSSRSSLAGVAYTATVAQAHALAEEMTAARRAGGRGLGPDAGPRAAAGAVRLRLRAHRRALQRRPADRGLGRDARLGGHAPRADHLRARLRAAPGPRDAPRAGEGGGLGRVPAGRRPDGRPDEPRGVRPRLVQAARPRGRAARERRARQAGQGRRAAGRRGGRLGQAGQPRRRAGADRRRAGRRRLARGRPGAAAGRRSWRSGSRPPAARRHGGRAASTSSPTGVDPLAAVPWWALSGLVARRLQDGADQPLWRAWATALLVQPDLRRALPDDVPAPGARPAADDLARAAAGAVVARRPVRAAGSGWPRSSSSGARATAAGAGRRSTRPRSWAPSWAWDVSRGARRRHPARAQPGGRRASPPGRRTT